MFTRSRKVDNSMKNYYIVIGAFVGVCLLSVLYVLLNPKKSFAQMPVIDDTAMLVHNGQQGSAFQRGENKFFQVIYKYILVIPCCCVGLEPSQCEDSFRKFPIRYPQRRSLQDPRGEPRWDSSWKVRLERKVPRVRPELDSPRKLLLNLCYSGSLCRSWSHLPTS